MLVGGLMVQAHAMMAGINSRPTFDADFMADILSDNLSATLSSVRWSATATG